MRLKDKISLITGAASGIGLETARAFAREGATVLLCDISAEGLEKACRTLSQESARFIAIQLDVTKEEDWIRTAQKVESQFGKLDVFFNNAGIAIAKPFADLSLAEFERQMAVNCTGAFLGIKYLAPLLVASGNGSIINTASDAATVGFVNHAAYGASKAAIAMLSQVAAAEYCRQNVRSNSIHPAAVATPMLMRPDEDITQDPGYFTHLGRILHPEDVAALVLFLASDDARMITGAKFALDGGGTGFQLGQPLRTD